MKQNSFKKRLTVFIVIAAFVVSIGIVMVDRGPKCIKAGCNMERESGSRYCYLHKPNSRKNTSSYDDSSYSSTSSDSSATESTGSPGGSSYSNKSGKTDSSYGGGTNLNPYASYDDGYDDIYMDEDYDYDRYQTDSDYADGVDDAMEEFEDDW